MISGKTIEAYKFVSSLLHRYIIKVIFVLLTVACQFSFSAELSDDFRLFFVPNEQSPLNVVLKDASILVDTPMDIPSAQEINVVIKKPRARWLWFNGIVRSRNRILLLVNDLPCEFIQGDDPNHTRSSEPVSCNHITQKKYSFNLLADKQALRVYKGSQYIATLLVGQSL